jgi:DNA-directed RNA polymerase subunit RPC12/RpoP
MARWESFVKCPGCGYDLATGEGQRSCAWGDCPYLPEELDVFCPNCRFNFMTKEGNALCGHPRTCEFGEDARSHVENLRTWVAAHPVV